MTDNALFGYSCLIDVSDDAGANYVTVGEWKQASIAFDGDMVDRTTTKTVVDDQTAGATGAWKRNRPGAKSWTASVSGLRIFGEAAQVKLVGALTGDKQIKCRFRPSGTGATKEELVGLAYVKSGKIDFETLNLDSATFDIIGDGPLTDAAQ